MAKISQYKHDIEEHQKILFCHISKIAGAPRRGRKGALKIGVLHAGEDHKIGPGTNFHKPRSANG